MTTTAQEHFDWSATRALEYVDLGQARNAIASLASDLNKHEGTQQILTLERHVVMLLEELIGGVEGVRRFITGLPGPDRFVFPAGTKPGGAQGDRSE